MGGGLVGSQIIRLGGNLVLTRLLFPEAFGLIALSMAIITGIAMLSDVGLRGAVIKSQRSGEPAFMQTVWTVQAIKGVLLAIVICLAGIPAARFYDQPVLMILLPVLSLDILFRNFKSVSLFIYDKNLLLRRQVVVDISSQLLGLVVMISWAYFYPSVWALVAGSLINSFIQLIVSYLLFEGRYSRFCWDKNAIKEIFSFGIWVFVSTALNLMSNQGDRLIMGAWMTMRQLGVYSIASIFASVVNLVISHLSVRLLQPLYRKHIDTGNFSRIGKVRFYLNTICILGCVALSWLGEILIDLFYDFRYIEAGWMTQLLAMRGIGFCMYSTLQAYLLSSGNSFSLMKYQVYHTSYLVISLIVGAQFGVAGIILAYSMSTIVCYPIMALEARKRGLSTIRLDCLLMVTGIVLCVIGWFILDSAVISHLKELLPNPVEEA